MHTNNDIRELMQAAWRNQATRVIDSDCPDIHPALEQPWRNVTDPLRNHMLYCPWCFDIYRFFSPRRRRSPETDESRADRRKNFWECCVQKLRDRLPGIPAPVPKMETATRTPVFRGTLPVAASIDPFMLSTPVIHELSISEISRLFPRFKQTNLEFSRKNQAPVMRISGLDPALSGQTAYLLVVRLADLQEYEATEDVRTMVTTIRRLLREARDEPDTRFAGLLDPLFSRSAVFSGMIRHTPKNTFGTVRFKLEPADAFGLRAPLRIWFLLVGY